MDRTAIILVISIAMQLAAVMLALRLIRITGFKTAWIAITCAILLMSVRRTITLYRVVSGDQSLAPDPAAETIALVISLLMVIGLAGIAPMIQSIKKSQRELRVSDERFRRLTEGSIQGILVHRNFRPLFANQAIADIFGYETPQDIAALKSTSSLIAPQDQTRVIGYKSARMRGKCTPTQYEYQGVKRDGSTIWLDSINTLIDWDGEPAIQSTQYDITERKRAEEELRSSQQLLKAVFDALPIWVVVKDKDSRCLMVNRQRLQDLKLPSEALLGRHTLDLPYGTPEQLARAFAADRQVLESGEPLENPEFEFTLPDGRLRMYSSNRVPLRNSLGEVIGLVVVSRDITELKETEAENARLLEQMQQARKMESIGRLASGIAHDFNNHLTVIIGVAKLILKQIPSDSPIREDLNEICRAGERSGQLTSQLLAFGRKQIVTPHDVDLNHMLLEYRGTLSRLIGEDVEIVIFPAKELGLVRIDPIQVDQLVMNLAINARDAMPSGGELVIETANVNLDEAFVKGSPGLKSGPHVMLAVSDSGTGIAPEILPHIFEPFYTTKDIGKGTGLGLATVYGIVKQNGGEIQVFSDPGAGTTFKIYFPRQDASDASAADNGKSTPMAMQGGHETILLVEDEEGVGTYARRTLQTLGYRVFTARNGPEALLVQDSCGQRIDLLLTDVVMPGMSGSELTGRLQRRHSDLRVLYMSGYADHAIERYGIIRRDNHFLPKPFTGEELSGMVRTALDSELIVT